MMAKPDDHEDDDDIGDQLGRVRVCRLQWNSSFSYIFWFIIQRRLKLGILGVALPCVCSAAYIIGGYRWIPAHANVDVKFVVSHRLNNELINWYFEPLRLRCMGNGEFGLLHFNHSISDRNIDKDHRIFRHDSTREFTSAYFPINSSDIHLVCIKFNAIWRSLIPGRAEFSLDFKFRLFVGTADEEMRWDEKVSCGWAKMERDRGCVQGPPSQSDCFVGVASALST